MEGSGIGHESTKRPSYLHAPRCSPNICSSCGANTTNDKTQEHDQKSHSDKSTTNSPKEKKESCQTHGFVHGMPAPNVTTIPTATTEEQERDVYAVPLPRYREKFGEGVRETTIEGLRKCANAGRVKHGAYVPEMSSTSLMSIRRDQDVKHDHNMSEIQPPSSIKRARRRCDLRSG